MARMSSISCLSRFFRLHRWSHCDCAGFWSRGLFGLRHSPSYLLDIASLHEPGVGAVCFVQVLAETSAYKNEVYLLPKQLDVKVTSYTFSTRYGALASSFSKNTPGHPEQFFISSTAPSLMEKLPTHAFVGNARHFVLLFISSTGVPDHHVWMMWRDSTTRPMQCISEHLNIFSSP